MKTSKKKQLSAKKAVPAKRLTKEEDPHKAIQNAFSLMSLGLIYDFIHKDETIQGLLIAKEFVDNDIVYILVPLIGEYEEVEIKLPLTGLSRVLIKSANPVYTQSCSIGEFLDSERDLVTSREATDMEMEAPLGEDDLGYGKVVGYKLDFTIMNRPILLLLQHDTISDEYNYYEFDMGYSAFGEPERYGIAKGIAKVNADMVAVTPKEAAENLKKDKEVDNLFTGKGVLDVTKYLGVNCKLGEKIYKIIAVFLNKDFKPAVTVAYDATTVLEDVLISDITLLPLSPAIPTIPKLDNLYHVPAHIIKTVQEDYPLYSVTDHTTYQIAADVQIMGYAFTKWWTTLGVVVADVKTNEYKTVTSYTLTSPNEKKTYKSNYSKGYSYKAPPKTVDAGFMYEPRIPAIIDL
jgi:hypothetical protein